MRFLLTDGLDAFWNGAIVGATFFTLAFGIILVYNRIRTGRWELPPAHRDS